MTSDQMHDLASLLLCPSCRSDRWRTSGTMAQGRIECLRCGSHYGCDAGVLDLGTTDEDQAVALEREAVRTSEHDPALGGIDDEFADLSRAEGALKDAILSLPHGNDSRYYREPGYFANVRNSVPAFEFLLANLPCSPGDRLLDLGADLTWSTSHFARRGFACVALDVNHHLGVGRLFHAHTGAPYHMVRTDMARVSFKDGAFAAVTALNALHHAASLGELAGNLSRLLANGGHLAFVEPYCVDQAEKDAFGREQIAVGINEHTYLLEEWDMAFRRVGLVARATRVADSFSAVYRKVGPGAATGETGLFSGFYSSRVALAATPRTEVSPGGRLDVPLRVENHGNGCWSPVSRFPVYASYHLFASRPGQDTQLVAFDNPRTPLPRELRPGDAALVTLEIPAPSTPGDYVAEVDLVHEYVSWFAPRGLSAPRVPFRVRA